MGLDPYSSFGSQLAKELVDEMIQGTSDMKLQVYKETLREFGWWDGDGPSQTGESSNQPAASERGGRGRGRGGSPTVPALTRLFLPCLHVQGQYNHGRSNRSSGIYIFTTRRLTTYR